MIGGLGFSPDRAWQCDREEQPRIDALANDRPPGLGKYPAHPEHGFSGGGRGVDPLLMQEWVDTQNPEPGIRQGRSKGRKGAGADGEARTQLVGIDHNISNL